MRTALAVATLAGGASLAIAQTIPANLATPAGLVDTSKPGFKMRIVQGNSRPP